MQVKQVNDHALLFAVDGAVIIKTDDGSELTITPRLARLLSPRLLEFSDIADAPTTTTMPVIFGNRTKLVN